MKTKKRGVSFTFLLILFFSLISISSASLGTFNEGDCIPIVTTLNATNVTLNVITSPTPNAEIILYNQPMDSNGNLFNYTFCNTNKVGIYTYGYSTNYGDFYSNTFGVYYWSLWFCLIMGIAIFCLLFFGIVKEDITIFSLGNFILFLYAILILWHGIDIYKNDLTMVLGTIFLGLAFYFSYKVYEGYNK